MKSEGPALADILRRVREISPEALKPGLMIYPIVADFYRIKGIKPDLRSIKELVTPKSNAVAQAAHIATAVWVLTAPELLKIEVRASKIESFFGSELNTLANLVSVEEIIEDEGKREEFVRRCLRLLDLRPAGESLNYAADRFKSLDTIETHQIESSSRDRLKRAMEVAAAMKQKAAEAAAAKISRE